MLERLKRSTQPLKAYDILEQTRPLGLKAPMSIYRALNSLTRRRLALRIASLNSYVAARGDSRDGAGTAFLICRRCGKASERAIDSRAMFSMLSADEFEIDEVFVEAFGACAEACGQKASAPK